MIFTDKPEGDEMNEQQVERMTVALESIAESLKVISRVGGSQVPGPLEMIGIQLHSIGESIDNLDVNTSRALELYVEKNTPKGFY